MNLPYNYLAVEGVALLLGDEHFEVAFGADLRRRDVLNDGIQDPIDALLFAVHAGLLDPAFLARAEEERILEELGGRV